MAIIRSSARPPQKHHPVEDFLDVLSLSLVGVGGVIVIGSIGSLAWNEKDICREFLPWEPPTCMEFFYIGSGCIVLGYITNKIKIHYFPPLEQTAVRRKIKKLIPGNDVKTRNIQSIRQQKSQQQPNFWRAKSKAIANSITACYSHIFTQLSTLTTDSQRWLVQSRSTLSSTLAWGQSKFFSKKNINPLSSYTLPPKKKKKINRGGKNQAHH